MLNNVGYTTVNIFIGYIGLILPSSLLLNRVSVHN